MCLCKSELLLNFHNDSPNGSHQKKKSDKEPYLISHALLFCGTMVFSYIKNRRGVGSCQQVPSKNFRPMIIIKPTESNLIQWFTCYYGLKSHGIESEV